MKERIRQILKEESLIPLVIRRRVSMEDIEEAFDFALERMAGSMTNPNSVIYKEKEHTTLRLFAKFVIDEMITYLEQDYFNDDSRIYFDDDDYYYNEIRKPLLKYYEKRIKEKFDEVKSDGLNESILSEDTEDNLKNLAIEDMTFAMEIAGGFENIIKKTNPTEKEIDEMITCYLDQNLYPDYNWGPDLFDFYKDEVKTFGLVDFYIDDDVAYIYFENHKGRTPNSLEIVDDLLIGYMNKTFNKRWIGPFKKWFEKNSGLKVNDIYLGTSSDTPENLSLNENSILKEDTSLKETVRNMVKTQGFKMASKIVGSLDEIHKILDLKGTQEDMIFIVNTILKHDIEDNICDFKISKSLHSIKIYVDIPKFDENEDEDAWVNRSQELKVSVHIGKYITWLGNGLVRGHRIHVQIGRCK